MEVLGIIPARGGSRGIPKKNIASLGGQPLISYSIRAAQQSKLVNKLVVSTDDSEIAEISSLLGVEIIQRPAEISGDDSASELALLHCLNQLQDQQKYFPDVIVFLQCTAPLVNKFDIDGTIELITNGKADTAFAAAKNHQFLWQYCNDELVGVNHNKMSRKMRQQLNPQYVEAGSVYAMCAKKFLEHEYRFFGNTEIFEISKTRLLEIDEPADLVIAEALVSQHNKSATEQK